MNVVVGGWCEGYVEDCRCMKGGVLECFLDNDEDLDQLVVSRYADSKIDSYRVRQKEKGSASSVFVSGSAIVAVPSRGVGMMSFPRISFPSIQSSTNQCTLSPSVHKYRCKER